MGGWPPPFLPYPPLVSVGQTIPAVITTDRRLDQAGAVAVSTARQRQKQMTGVLPRRRGGRGIALATDPPPNHFAHELTQF